MRAATEGERVWRRGGQPDRALARRLAVASALAVLAAAICYLVMVRTSLGQRFDNAAYLGARDQVPSVAATDSSDLHRITADSFAIVLAVLVVLGAMRRRLLLGVGAALAAGVAVVATHLLKMDVLTRPHLVADVYTAQNTFPSGHTAAAVVCAMALVLVSPPRWRGAAAVVAGAYGWVTAAQVQTAGWHRPSDAIGAALLAFAAVTAMGAVLARTCTITWARHTRHWLAFGVLGAVALGALVVVVRGLAEVLSYLRDHALGLALPLGMRHDAYITGLAVTVDVVVLLLMALLALIGQPDLGGIIPPGAG